LFKASGNVGMLDIVAALAWVRDNIADFGGDPGRVLIFGESGGGQKVSTLLAMPPAKGLFNRGVIESGPGVKMNSLEYATKVGDMVLAELGIKLASIRDIQTLPLDRIMAAQGAVNRKLGGFIPGMIAGFSPVVDGVSLLQNPFDPVAPEVSAGVPVLIGFNRTGLTLFAGGYTAEGWIYRSRLLVGNLHRRTARGILKVRLEQSALFERNKSKQIPCSSYVPVGRVSRCFSVSSVT
jgi:para-nitrobenzyl esterase